MKVTFLGTGTSVGVPMIGCECAVCTSRDPRNRRRRSSIHVEACGMHIQVDTPPDFREQALAGRLPRIDAVVFTHAHADHIFGFDDIRRFNVIQREVIPAYASPSVIEDLTRVFNYIGVDEADGVYRPRVKFMPIETGFSVGQVDITPVPVVHGPKPAHGYVFRAEGRSVGYVPDCNRMSDHSVGLLQGLDVMILNALRHHPHSTHMTVRESLSLLRRIDARRSYLIHMSHDLDHETTQRALPEGVFVSHDGLVLEW